MIAMFSRLLFPVELSDTSEKMFCAVQELVTAGVRDITLFHVVSHQDAEADAKVLPYGREVLEDWTRRLRWVGVPRVFPLLSVGIPWEEIVEEARQGEYSVILMGSKGKGMIQELLLGKETENVLRHTNRPLLIMRLNIVETADERSCALVSARLFKHILYATDFSDDAKKCLPYLEQMVAAEPEELTIVHIQDLRSLGSAMKAQMAEYNLRDAKRLEELKARFTGLGYRTIDTILRTGDAITDLLAILRERKPSLLVLGAKGRTNVPAMVLGRVSESLIHQGEGHVLVVR
jgi:nucleotide-binding universal stress UspA family protein